MAHQSVGRLGLFLPKRVTPSSYELRSLDVRPIRVALAFRSLPCCTRWGHAEHRGCSQMTTIQSHIE